MPQVVDPGVMTQFLMGGECGAAESCYSAGLSEWAAAVILMSELRNVLLRFGVERTLNSDDAKAMSDDVAEILGDRFREVSG